MTKQEAVAKLNEQGYTLTPEEAKALEALFPAGTGEITDSQLNDVVGGMDPKFKKALIGAGIIALAAVGGGYILKKRRASSVPTVAEGEEDEDVDVADILPESEVTMVGGYGLRKRK